MRGRIIKRYKGSYNIILSLGRDPKTMKYRQKWISFKGTKKQAEKKLTELLYQYDGGANLNPSFLTLGEYLNTWVNDLKPNVAPRTYERYEGIIRQHIIPDIGNHVLDSLTPAAIQSHYTRAIKKGLSPRTVHNHHVVIHHALKTALRRGILSRNVADAVDPPRFKKREMCVWEADEVRHFLLLNREHFMYPIFYMALFTGMRRSEILGLIWRDIDLGNNQLSVNRALIYLRDGTWTFSQLKTASSRRVIPLSPSTIELLTRHKDNHLLDTDDDRLFRPLDGEYWNHNRVTYEWNKACKAAGLRSIRFHDARHTHASLLLKQKVHPKIVQERLGHSSIQMTLDTYSHVMPGIQEEAMRSFDSTVL